MTLHYSDHAVDLYLGDCREHTAWLDADILITDPPFGIAWRRNLNNARKSSAHPGIANDHNTEARDTAHAMWGGDRPAIIFGSFNAPAPAHVRQVLVFAKPGDAGVVGSTTGFRRDIEAIYLCGPWPRRNAHRSSVIATRATNAGSPNSAAGRYGHPHAKPLDVMETLIGACPPGVIADPFAGTGSTLVAARNLGRKAIGVELDPTHARTAARRLAQGTLNLGDPA